MNIWAFDIETEAWDKFVIAAAYNWNTKEMFLLRDIDEVRDWYLSLPVGSIVISYYGGGFDFIFLISIFPDYPWNIKMAGSSVIFCQIPGGAECIDASRLFPGSLEKWTGEKTKLGFDCECGKKCGGFCAIRRDMPRERMKVLEGYVCNDAVVLANRYVSDVALLESFGFEMYSRGKVRLTMGSVAWHTAAKMVGINTKKTIPWAEYDASRRAYYGGRVEPLCTIADKVEVYDMNAMYPAMLKRDVPVGIGRNLIGYHASNAYREGRHGIYFAECYLKESELAQLPHRYIEQAKGRLYPGKLMWTTGHIGGWYTLPELQAAELNGAEIQRISLARVYDHVEPLFAPYIDFVYGIREKAKSEGDDRLAALVKWYANAPSGKFAQRPVNTTARVLAENETPKLGESWVGGRIWSKPAPRRVPGSARPIVAAYLTSNGRIELYNRLKNNEGHTAYCDTDSTVLLRKDDSNVDPTRLGAWKFEGTLIDWRCIGPKMYRGVWDKPGHKDHGKDYVRAKGIPHITKEDFERFARGEPIVHERGVKKLKTSGGLFERVRLVRTNKTPANMAGTRIVLENGRTRPLHRQRNGDYE